MENKSTRLSKAARMFNVGISTIVEFLAKKDIHIDSGPNTKISPEAFDFLAEEYSSDLSIKQKSEELSRKNLQEFQESIISCKAVEGSFQSKFRQYKRTRFQLSLFSATLLLQADRDEYPHLSH